MAVQHKQGWAADLMAVLRSVGVDMVPNFMANALPDWVEEKLQQKHLNKLAQHPPR